MYNPPAGVSAGDIKEHARVLAQEQEQLEEQLFRNAAVLQADIPITVDRVRQALPADAALLEWFRYAPFDLSRQVFGAPRYAVFLLRRTEDPIAIDLGLAQPIEDLATEFRRALHDPATKYYMAVAKDLSEKLIKPLASHLTRGEQLLLVPDAALNLVSFAALVDEHGDYLVQHFGITYLTSGRDLLRFAHEPSPRGGPVVLADPSYGTATVPGETGLQLTRSGELDRSGLVFAPLPASAFEAKAVQSMLKLDPQNVLTGDRATEARLRELRGPSILHLATHAFFLNDQEISAALGSTGLGLGGPEALFTVRQNPLLRAGLALAGANERHSGATDDGILTAAEAAQLDLVGTQLAVLSACDTGVGEVRTGEGVYGLRRALVLAGAQAQLVSLWKVADAATQELIVDYYRRLLTGGGRSGALREAQLAMMANPVRQHPYYWAGFIFIGNWTPLTPGGQAPRR
jgi:CHAT domain-containing protein